MSSPHVTKDLPIKTDASQITGRQLKLIGYSKAGVPDTDCPGSVIQWNMWWEQISCGCHTDSACLWLGATLSRTSTGVEIALPSKALRATAVFTPWVSGQVYIGCGLISARGSITCTSQLGIFDYSGRHWCQPFKSFVWPRRPMLFWSAAIHSVCIKEKIPVCRSVDTL